ncbi:hypothetical protein DK419_02415 [Methylobacterium terrae]|uniref:Uncharacterized protein n=1 Tax=Methylobacterium terrae TaxID=2202827 RepID=A0A2U8WIE6_9HYPH|nr:hypothetical protein [Methylobacterium terrae]AWN45318.1 hypothetical protein DK419_02415 [Methylobacterium terrae]
MNFDFFERLRASRPGDESDWFEESFVANLGEVIRSVGVMNARHGLAPVDGRSPSRDWDRLIAHVRDAARAAGEGEERHERQVRDLLDGAHARLDAAEARARAAEARAEALIAAAELRARRAEAAARAAEAALLRAGPPEACAVVPAARILRRAG